MNEKNIARAIVKAVLILVALSVGVYLLYLLRSLLVYTLVAVVISLIGRPMVMLLKRRLKMRQTLAVIVTIFLFCAIVVGFFSLVIPLLISQIQEILQLDLKTFEEKISQLQLEIENYLGIKFSSFYDAITSGTASKLQSFLISSLNGILGGLGNFVVAMSSILFMTFFFMKENQLFDRMVLTLFKDSKEEKVKKSLEGIKQLLSRYFLGLCIQIFILFVLYYITLLVFGTNNAIIIAMLCALLNLVPYIGPICGGILMTAFTMTTYLGQDFSTVVLPKTLWVLFSFILVQILDAVFSQPYIYSSSVRSHPLEIFVVIIAGGILFGVVGMMVAIPAYTMIKVVAKEFYNNNKVVKNLTKNL